MLTEKIAFDDEFDRGIAAYNEKVGRWWFRQATNSIHSHAYRNIADFVRSSFARPPGLIVDYACGAGNLMTRLHHRFPGSQLMGLDGSSFLLGLARRRVARNGRRALQRITLIETLLPNFGLHRAVADLVVYSFPNMVPCSPEDDGGWATYLSPTDIALARDLAGQHDPESARDGDPQAICAMLLRDRLVSLNIRSLLKRGGICMRVEYGNVRRERLPRLELLRTEFEEGTLDHEVNGKTADQWFRILASRYYRSGVMEDVYHQSEDESDRMGGYFITVLRAL